MNKPLKIGLSVFALTVLVNLTSCQKNDRSLSQGIDTQSNNQQKKVPRQSSSEGPARRWVAVLEDCDNVQENCAPMDVVVVANPTDICIPCKVLREIIGHGTFRANSNFGYDHIGKNFPGVNSAEELNQLDDYTFYATLFPNLNDVQRSMFYSGQYEIMLKHNEGQEKFFILFGKKGQSMDNIEASPVFVVPFIFDYK